MHRILKAKQSVKFVPVLDDIGEVPKFEHITEVAWCLLSFHPHGFIHYTCEEAG